MPEASRALGPRRRGAAGRNARRRRRGARRSGSRDRRRRSPAIRTADAVRFSTDAAECARSGTCARACFPSVGAMRHDRHDRDHRGRRVPGRAAGRGDARPAAAARSATAIADAIIFGHALEGNLHFVFTQDFNSRRRGRALSRLHGRAVRDWSSKNTTARSRPSTAPVATSRPSSSSNGAREAYALMRAHQARCSIRTACSTPASILNDDREAHLKNLKPLPAAIRSSTRASSAASASPSARRAG